MLICRDGIWVLFLYIVWEKSFYVYDHSKKKKKKKRHVEKYSISKELASRLDREETKIQDNDTMSYFFKPILNNCDWQ